MNDADARASLLNVLDHKLDEILECPAGWGGLDALEPLVLTLLMLRVKVEDPLVDDRQVLRSYRRFLATRVGPGAADLKTRLGEDLSEMSSILRAYVETMRPQPSAGGSIRLPDPPAHRSIGGEAAIDITKPHYRHRRAS